MISKKNTGNTIVDIARALDISPSTVSRALKDHPYISQATKDRVKKQAAKMGYRHNALAAGLRNRKSNTIGLICPRISMYFQSSIVTAIQRKVQEAGYSLVICQTNDSYEIEKQVVNALYASRVEGLIASCTLHTEDFSHFDIFSKSGIPLVFYDRVPRSYPAQVIRGDDYRGGTEGAEHLISRGCKQIVYISGPLTCNLYQDRYAGFKDALQRHKLPLPKKNLFFHELTLENARRTCERIFSKKPWPDAIFATNDTTAIVAEQYAREAGLKIPGDIKILGYSNDPRTEIIDPALTSVEQFPAVMGEKAADAVVELIRKKTQLKKTMPPIITPVELVVRASTGGRMAGS
ncbi:LacI family DNA-binding transcriptional regulator [Compostibacter hankyongensis]|uniref:LacI family DNA-binding transcriptional regulator n=1 Tax=Compostibacter hankyongensis TaxID=1007089 RepID=A0ABP8FUJ8_9BACT